MNTYQLRDIHTGHIQVMKPDEGFDPMFYTPPDGFQLWEQKGDTWAIYRRPTAIDLMEKAKADFSEAQHWIEAGLDHLDDLERLYG